MLIYHLMHLTNSDIKNRTTKGGSVLLLKKIKIKSLPMEGGAILSNRNIGITSNAVKAPPSMSMAFIGDSVDFNKHVKVQSRNV
jgi:hypothetical protein